MTSRSGKSLPDDVLAALQRGQPIEAIKLLRASSGLGLKEARDAIERHRFAPASTGSMGSDALPAAVNDALQRGRKIEAIRLLRQHTGIGLKEAKQRVEAAAVGAVPQRPDLAPGEVPRGVSSWWWRVALGLLIAWAALQWLADKI